MLKRLCQVAVVTATFALAQPVAFPTTTLKVAMTGWPSATQPQLVVYLTSNAAIVPGQLPISQGTGDPSGHTAQILMIDREALCINGPVRPDGGIPIERGCQGSYALAHNVGETVWVGYPSYYAWTIPSGPCNAATLPVLPTVYILTAGVYNCIAGSWKYIGTTGPGVVPPPYPPTGSPWYKKVLKAIIGNG